MDAEKVMHTKWREAITKFFFILCIGIFVLEVAYGIVLWVGNEISIPIVQYIFVRILVPTFLNFGITFVSYLVGNNENAADEWKDLFVVINSFVLSIIVVIFHSYFTAIIAVMCLPIITALLVGNKRLYQLICILVALGSIMHFYFESSDYLSAPSYYFLLNYVVFIFIEIGFYLVGTSYIKTYNEFLASTQNKIEEIAKENWNVIHDDKSKLYNYIAFRAKIKELIRVSKEDKFKTVTMGMFEIDNVRDINVNYGNDVGNSVIIAFAQILEQEITDKIFIAKNENSFYALFNDLNVNDIINFINRVKEKIYKSDNSLIAEGNVTFASGIVEYDNTDEDTFFENCRKALKQAENNGSNQTVIVR